VGAAEPPNAEGRGWLAAAPNVAGGAAEAKLPKAEPPRFAVLWPKAEGALLPPKADGAPPPNAEGAAAPKADGAAAPNAEGAAEEPNAEVAPKAEGAPKAVDGLPRGCCGTSVRTAHGWRPRARTSFLHESPKRHWPRRKNWHTAMGA
jgi:hypothetical protein